MNAVLIAIRLATTLPAALVTVGGGVVEDVAVSYNMNLAMVEYKYLIKKLIVTPQVSMHNKREYYIQCEYYCR